MRDAELRPPDAALPDAETPGSDAEPDAGISCAQPGPSATPTSLLPSNGENTSQYSPFVLHKPGWQSYLMYYCKNTPINGVWRDRIWRAESWTDGLGEWNPGQVVIEGQLGRDDDLSCSPGVVIDAAGTWHMYYVGADRDTPMTLFLFHATAQAPGLVWTKQGKISGAFPQPAAGYLETPTPVLAPGGRIVLYYVGPGGKLHRAESQDGHTFSAPIQLPSPDWATHGRVASHGGCTYYIYSTNPSGCCDPPTEIRISVSRDGLTFGPGDLLFLAAGTGWDGSRVWAPAPVFLGTELRVYYAANLDDPGCSPACDAAHSCQAGTCVWWGADSVIGVRTFSLQ